MAQYPRDYTLSIKQETKMPAIQTILRERKGPIIQVYGGVQTPLNPINFAPGKQKARIMAIVQPKRKPNK